MPDERPPAGRRRLLLIVAAALCVIGVIVGTTIYLQSRAPTRSVANLCSRLGDARNLDRSLTSLDPSTLKPQVAALTRAERVAPNDISPAMHTLATFVGSVLADVDASGEDRRAAFADALDSRSEQIDSVSAAGTAVSTWAAANCAIDLGGPGTTTAGR